MASTPKTPLSFTNPLKTAGLVYYRMIYLTDTKPTDTRLKISSTGNKDKKKLRVNKYKVGLKVPINVTASKKLNII